MTERPSHPDLGWGIAAKSRIEDAVSVVMASARPEQSRLVLVLPPFASPDRPSLGLHVLERVADANGWPTCVLYANLSFARVVGPHLYRTLCHSPTQDLVGERIFRTSYGVTAQHGPGSEPDCWATLADSCAPPFENMQQVAKLWAARLSAALAALPAPVIGVSSVFEQTLSSLALIEGIKARAPDKKTLLGGANADDEMGLGLADLAPEVDHVFQGEAEASLKEFIALTEASETPPRIMAGQVNSTLDTLDAPVYDGFFTQFNALIHEANCPNGLDKRELRLPYESSRGCWWGAKHHCTFCGLNANGMNHRIKAPEKVSQEIGTLADRHGLNRILMVDNIMPHSYVSTLLPELAATERRLEIFYEQKANLSLNRMALLEAAGVTSIQPGIEALSTALLRRMRKGSTAQINIDCLRYARAAGVRTVWNLLSDFPGDDAADYEETIEIAPTLHHLQPPGGVGGLSIDRFSPYYTDPGTFGIQDMTPLDAYAEVFPGVADSRLAYHFQGDYTSAIRRDPDLYGRLSRVVEDWDAAWRSEALPLLFVFDLGPNRHLVIDTRTISVDPSRIVDTAEAHIILTGSSELCAATRRALERYQLAEIDGRFGAIACATLTSPAWTKKAAAGSLTLEDQT